MFFSNPYFYYVVVGLQAICAIHCYRKGNVNKWIWLIVFLPVVGCLIYIFTEMFTRGDMQNMQEGMGAVFNPSGRIRRLEENLRFSDTFNNKIALAEAYLDVGQTERAITLYESSLVGNFTENDLVLKQLIIAYARMKRYDDIIPLAKKIYKQPQFARSKAHIIYAIALEHTGEPELAEKEFKLMKARYSNFEARYQYGRFLARANRIEEAKQVFAEMLGEESHLTSIERRGNRQWFALTKDELKKISVQPT